MCIIVEPTRRSIEVFHKYIELAKSADTHKNIVVIGNKIRNEEDQKFIEQQISREYILGFFNDDLYLRKSDQNAQPLNFEEISNHNKTVIESVKNKLETQPKGMQKRLEKLWKLHKKYVAQKFISDRFGDLTNQIDTSFNFDDTKNEK